MIKISGRHIFFSSNEQAIDLEHDPDSEEAVIHFRPCENVVQTRKIKRQEVEKVIFQAIKEKFF